MKPATDRIADYLARRDHSKKELVDKLSRFDYTREEIQTAVERAIENKWLLPEAELAEKVCEGLHRKNKGHHYIQGYLQSKGLPEVAEDPEREFSKALSLIETLSDREKAIRKLNNRGFGYDTIRKVLDEKF